MPESVCRMLASVALWSLPRLPPSPTLARAARYVCTVTCAMHVQRPDESCSPAQWRDYTYTAADWNPLTLEDCLVPGVAGPVVYSASKTLAEHAAHDFAAANPDMVISTLNPPMIYGPPLQKVASRDEINTSSGAIYALIHGPEGREVPWNRLPLFVHVKDIGLAHLRVIEAEDEAKIKNQRFLLYGGAFAWEDVSRHLDLRFCLTPGADFSFRTFVGDLSSCDGPSGAQIAPARLAAVARAIQGPRETAREARLHAGARSARHEGPGRLEGDARRIDRRARRDREAVRVEVRRSPVNIHFRRETLLYGSKGWGLAPPGRGSLSMYSAGSIHYRTSSPLRFCVMPH